MFVRIWLSAATLLIAAAPALADVSTCGDAPFAPALPSTSDMARLAPADAAASKHRAFQDVTDWQRDLKGYRACLDAAVSSDNVQISSNQGSTDKVDQDKIKALQADVAKANAMYNRTVETEKSIVGSYVALSNAYCSRKDVDLSICQKSQ
jgi:hypothetical protein